MMWSIGAFFASSSLIAFTWASVYRRRREVLLIPCAAASVFIDGRGSESSLAYAVMRERTSVRMLMRDSEYSTADENHSAVSLSGDVGGGGSTSHTWDQSVSVTRANSSGMTRSAESVGCGRDMAQAYRRRREVTKCQYAKCLRTMATHARVVCDSSRRARGSEWSPWRRSQLIAASSR